MSGEMGVEGAEPLAVEPSGAAVTVPDGDSVADGSDEASGLDPIGLSDDDREQLAEPDPSPEQVTYSGTDFDVEGLTNRLGRGDIVIPTFGRGDLSIETAGFQRRFVWRRTQMERFVESILMGYPIPGIFLVQQADKRYLVLDGQQRLTTLAAFIEGTHDGEPFVLQGVAQRFKGASFATLTPELRRQFSDTFIQATIVKTDGSKGSLEAVYQIFERLNSGGTQLTPHEIRVALYAGSFIEFLTMLNANPDWRALYGPISPRLRDQEIVLRAMALYVAPGTYSRPLKKYLNDFVADHRDLQSLPSEAIKDRFDESTKLLRDGPGRTALRAAVGRQVNAALAEAVLVGLARRLDAGNPPSPEAVGDAVEKLQAHPDLERTISQATADEESVRTRLAVASQIFAAI